MVNVPSRTAQMRLVGVMSQLYAGHFALVASRLNDPDKAYRIIERARGRALADILRVVPSDDPGPADDERLRAIAALQLRLMRARTATERQRVLDDLLDVEQHVAVTVSGPAGCATGCRSAIRERPRSARCSERWRRPKCCLNSCCLNRVPTVWSSPDTAFSWCRSPARHALRLSRSALARLCRRVDRLNRRKIASSMTPCSRHSPGTGMAPGACLWCLTDSSISFRLMP